MGVAELQNEQNGVQNEINSVEGQKAVNNEKIGRLQLAKTAIEEIKDEVYTLYKAVDGKKEQKDTWAGSKYTDYFGFVADSFVYDYKAYYTLLDNYLDAICDKITQLQNENNSHDGLLGWLRSRWNSLANEINKIFN